MSAIDDLTPVPNQPQISEGNKTFSQKTFALWLWIITRLVPAMVLLRDLIVNSVTGAFTGTSTTSVTITDTGEVSITTDAGRSFKPGTPVRLAYRTDPRIYIDGITKTYNDSTGAYVFYAQAKAGSGTYADWSLSIIPSGGGLAGLGSNTFVGAQYVPDDPYDATAWNGSNAVPTKNSIRDALVALVSGLPGLKNATNDPSFLSGSSTDAASPEWVYRKTNMAGASQSVTLVSGVTYTNSSGRKKRFSCQVAYTSIGTFVVDVGGNTILNVGNSSGTFQFTFDVEDGAGYTYSVTGGAVASNFKEN